MKTIHTSKLYTSLKRSLPALLLAAFAIGAAPSARAQVVATDNFDSYTDGATVVGGVSGTGWSAAWSGSSSHATVVNDSITYTLDNGEVRGGGNALKITAPSAAETVGILERAVPEITDGGDVFVSLVFKVKSDSADGSTFTDNNNVYYYAGDGAKSPTHDASGYAGYGGKAGARLAGGWRSTDTSLVVGQTYFLVIRYSGWNTGSKSTNTYDTITTWLNPATTDEDAGTKSGDNTSNDKTKAITREGDTAGYGSASFSSLYLNTLGLNSADRFHVIDDIRIGRSWVDVVGIPMPVVDTISPSTAIPGGTVVFSGKNLADVTVTIGGEPAVITEQTATSLTLTVPASLVKGVYDVIVTGAGGSVTKNITVNTPPIIGSVTPGSGVAGETVVIVGANFDGATVSIGGLPAGIVTNTGTELTITIPAGLGNGEQPLIVTSSVGSDNAVFTNTAPTPSAPEVTGSDALHYASGSTVTLTGSNLVGTTSVTVGGIEVEITSRADGSLTFALPDGLLNGDYTVVVTTSGGETSATVTVSTLVAIDNFNSYTADATVVGGASGAGWSAAWSGSSNNAMVVGESITYTLDNGEVRGGGNALKITAPDATETVGILERAVPEITDGGDVFVSLIFKIKSDSADGSTLADNNTVYYLAGDGAKDPERDASGYAGYGGKAGARLGGGRLPVTTSLVAGQTYFLVIRYSGWNTGVQAYDIISTWLNPATTDEGAATTSGNNTTNDGTKAITREGNSPGYGSAKFSSLYLNTLGLNSTDRFHVIDDIRIGRSWADVVGVPMPVVDSISPASIKGGDSVVITGKNLADVTVTLDGEAAVITGQTATSLTLTIPATFATGAYDLVITGPGGSLTKTLNVTTILPNISAVTPDNGVAGDTVVIAGANFDGATVSMGGLPVTIVSSSDTELTITIPAGLAGGAQTITVTNSIGNGTAAFTNNASTPSAPGITGMNASHYASGATVTLTGSNLAGATSVKVGGADVEIISRADGALSFNLPDGLLNGDYTVVVTTAGGETSTTVTISTLVAIDNFDSYTATTTVGGGAGGAGWSAGWVTAQGSEYATVVDESITYTLDNGRVLGGGNALKITAPVAAETVGVLERAVPEITDGGDVFVSLIFKVQNSSPDGSAFTDNNTVYYYAGDGNKNVNQDASGFAGYEGKAGARLSTGRVYVNNPLATGQTYFLVIRYSGWNSGVQAYDTITTWLNPATTDEGAATTSGNNSGNDKTKAITREGNTANFGSTKFSSLYLNTLGLNSTNRFHVIDDVRIGRSWADVVGVPMPVVETIVPTMALPGSTVTLSGKNLDDVTVTFGGNPIVPTEQTATSLAFTVPDSTIKGVYDVVVTGPGGSVTRSVTVSIPPAIASITPDNGVAGDTAVIAGLNFEEVSVSMGGLPVDIVSSTDTQLTITIPAGLANGAQTVTVGNSTGSDTIVFTNNAPTPPAPEAASVDSPFYATGATVTIVGGNLVGATSVTVGGVDVEIISRADDTLVFKVPEGLPLGENTVVINTAGGETSIIINVSTLVAVDNFDTYAPGSSVVGGAAGNGWSGGWTGQTDHATVVGESITYTLDNGVVRGGGNALKITAPGTYDVVGMLEREVPEITDGGDVFVSLVFKIQNGSENGSFFKDNNNIYYVAGDGDKVSNRDAMGYAGYGGNAGARLAGGWRDVDNPLVIGQTYFLVIRYSGWNTGSKSTQTYDTITTWLNPATTDEDVGTKSGENSSNDKTKAITREGDTAGYGSTSFSSLYLSTLGLDSTNRFHVIDDIRIGRTWVDVVGIPMPVVESISPAGVMAGNPIVITGKNLGDVTVTIGGEDIAITEQNATSLTLTVPASFSKGMYDMVITGEGGSLTKSLIIVLPPAIDSVTPSSAGAGATVIVSGENFEYTHATIGGLPVESEWSSDGTQLTVVIPEGLANGAQTITVANDAGVATIAFTNTSPTPPPPAVSDTNLGYCRPGATVTIPGDHLAGATSVTVDGIDAEIVSRADDTLVIIIPDGLANGEYPVVITTAGGETNATILVTDIIATDNFEDYAAGAMLAGSSGGKGWSGAWAANAGVTVTDDPADVITYTMSDGTVLGGGKSLKLAADTPVGATLPRLLDRNLDQPVTSGKDVFVSFIFKIKNPNAPDGELVPAGDNVTSIWYAKDSDSNLRFDTLGYIGYSGKVGASMGAPTNARLVSTELKTGQTYFAVVRYGGWNGTSYKTCQVWLNPATNDETAVSTTITNSITQTSANVGSDGFLGLLVGGYGITSGRYQVIDDIRVGYTWAAVTNPRTAFIASEDFDSYAPGSKLADASGGAGWDGPWSANADATIIDDSADAVTYTLNDGTVRGGGSALKISSSSVNASLVANSVLERRFSAVPKGEDVYASFVFKVKSPDIPDGSPLDGVLSAYWYAADDARDSGKDIAAYVGRNGKVGGIVSNTAHSVDNTLIAGKPYFMVIRYGGWDAAANVYKTCRVWLNPTTDDRDTSDPTIAVDANDSVSGFGNPHIDGLYVNTLGLTLNGAYHVVDDIRVGTDWASVVGEPTPAFEPGTPPQLNALPAGEVYPGRIITITGSDFTGLVRVLIGGVEATIVGHTDTTIYATVPQGTINGSVAVLTSFGSVVSSDSLAIATQPVFVTNPEPVQVAVKGRPVDFLVDVWAFGAVSYKWQYRTGESDNWKTVSGSIGAGADTADLSVFSPDNKNGWQFRCVASTSAGTAESAISTLSVIDNLLNTPAGLVVGAGDYSKYVYVSDRGAHTVSVLAPDGGLALLAGSSGTAGSADGSGATARFDAPRGLALSSTDSLIVADSGNERVRSIALATSTVRTIGATGPDALLDSPASVAVGSSGTTYVADTGNHLIKFIGETGDMEILAGSGVSGTDNGSLLDAKFNAPAGLAVSAADGRIYVADKDNHVIRLIDLATGQVSTFAGQMGTAGNLDGAALATASFDSPTGLALDVSGDLYVADSGNSRIRVITSSAPGVADAVITLAGSAPGFRDGPGKNALFANPESLAIAGDGVLYVADTGNGVVRRIDTSADALVSTPAMKKTDSPPPGPVHPGGGDNGNGAGGGGGGGGGGSTSIWFLLALAACAALRGRKK